MKNKKNGIRKIIKMCAVSITILIFIFCIYIMISGTKALKENRLMKIFGYSYSVVPTESMLDTIKVNDIIIIDDVPYSELGQDDIIVYFNPQENLNVVHRIIGTHDDGSFKTKGDNNSSPDTIHVTEELYRGKVIKWGSFLGVGNLILNGRSFIFILIMLIFVYFIISEIFNIAKILKEKQKEAINNIEQESLERIREKLKQEVLEEIKEDAKDSEE